MEREHGQAYAMQRYREEVRKEGEQVGVKSAIHVILYMVAYTLNYKLGFGRKRLLRIMKQIIDNIDCYRTGQLDPNDYKEIIKMMNELGFKVEERT
jgi:CRISPR/Cas system CSM-associated protein Csm2 small subunit